MCAHMYVKAGYQRWLMPLRHQPLLLKQCLSLPWSLPRRLDRQTSKSQGSTYVHWLVMGLQSCTIIPDPFEKV